MGCVCVKPYVWLRICVCGRRCVTVHACIFVLRVRLHVVRKRAAGFAKERRVRAHAYAHTHVCVRACMRICVCVSCVRARLD